jgi:16S rRNA processing protein RimM
MSDNPLIPIGQVVGAHGINGAVKVQYYDTQPRSIASGDTLTMITPRGARTNYVVEWARPHKRSYLMGLTGIGDRNQAEALRGCQLVVRQSELPTLEADTFYWADLIGMAVYTLEDRYLGQIESIIPTGSNDVYVVRNDDAETLVPALKRVVQSVDLNARTMRVDLPEGL